MTKNRIKHLPSPQPDHVIKPRIKQGALVVAGSTNSYVGRMDHGIEIFAQSRIALEQMNGHLTCKELSSDLEIPLHEIYELVAALDDANLLDTEIAKISVHTRFHSANANRASHSTDDRNDAAHQQLLTKLVPELAYATWQEGVRDGGVGLLGARRNVTITIFGSSRIAVLLYGILLASGFSSTNIHIRDARNISDNDVSAGFLRSSDIGISIRERLQELSRELSLFPLTSRPKSASIASESQSHDGQDINRTIAIAVGEVPADQIQEWMSRGIPHLIIENPDGPSLTMGPLVIPGYSPCLRCIAMSKEEIHGRWKEIAWHRIGVLPDEVPVSVAHHISGLAALEILRFVDEGKSELIGASVRMDYRDPRGSERRLFTRHPACGCNW